MIIAYYARKSNDKNNDSLENQFAIIDSYVSKQKDLNGAEIVRYTDNGHSGINLERDSFQDLLAKVRRREIDVVAVKDFSRLGRNYLDVCTLTDSVFPFMGVRLIAISENYDSKYRVRNSMDLSMAFRAILDEYYVTESSEKIRKVFANKIRQGRYTSGLPPYGYNLSDECKLIINDSKADIVRDIFSLYLENKSIIRVAGILNERGLRTNKGKKWSDSAVSYILKNERYTGKQTSFKRVMDIKTKRFKATDESEWFINENAYPPIIEREVFDNVQLIMASRAGNVATSKGNYIMTRKIYCAGCGFALGKAYDSSPNFYCKQRYITGGKPCFKGRLRYDILYEAVLEKVKSLIDEELQSSKSRFSYSDIVRIEAEITKLKNKKAEIFEELFSNYITENEFNQKNKEVTAKIEERQDELQECRRIVALNTKHGKSERPIDTLKRLFEAEELTKEHMQFVKRINVFNAEKFEIHMQTDSPLTVLCRNMSIYEEV